ncbi:MAG: Ribosomal RNA small subunit methyltransferase Nep1 [Promethearchaeota archaeon]|nr:MAG: Ribosomal RNA small subunit methyltransferase Nep1 [Candidatus Lokiarchaeota archaeon]
MPLILILAECGLEIIPKKLRRHPAVKRNTNKKLYSSQLLDSALHHSAMKKLKDYDKRGRPDILHLGLLNALGSPLNKSGNLQLYIHTIRNKIFKVNPDVRIAKNYNRFKGLMGKLLIDGEIKFEDLSLFSPVKGSLKKLIESYKDPDVLLFSSRGKLIKDTKQIFSEDLSKDYIGIIGGFQKGTFSHKILNLSQNLISISEYKLNSWIVVSRAVVFYELIHQLL